MRSCVPAHCWPSRIGVLKCGDDLPPNQRAFCGVRGGVGPVAPPVHESPVPNEGFLPRRCLEAIELVDPVEHPRLEEAGGPSPKLMSIPANDVSTRRCLTRSVRSQGCRPSRPIGPKQGGRLNDPALRVENEVLHRGPLRNQSGCGRQRGTRVKVALAGAGQPTSGAGAERTSARQSAAGPAAKATAQRTIICTRRRAHSATTS